MFLFQSPQRVEVEVGGSAALRCTQQFPTSCYSVSWVKVQPRTSEVASVPHAHASSSGGGASCTLSIGNASEQDSGTYYCLAVVSSMSYFGNGTRVITLHRSPSVQTLCPSDSDSSPVPLVCLVRGVVQSRVHVHWMIDGTEHSGWTNSDEVSTQNHLLVPVDQWRARAVCTCVVDIGGEETIYRSIQWNGKETLLRHSSVCP
uniref:Ig-like domain-containing protein n=1 Tax=Denticeps clupeoides TaxID=299321 RepID=A0AAY4EJT1_9TELE